MFLVTTMVLFLTALAAGSYFLYKHLKSKKIAPPLSPKEWAIAELSKLTPEMYETKQEFKEFYFVITRIYKTFLYKKFLWDVQEKTDTELISLLRKKHFEETIIEKLETIFNGSLLIKFANAQALKDQAKTDLKNLMSIL